MYVEGGSWYVLLPASFGSPSLTSRSVINHVPISGVGSRQIKHFELPLIRFDLPPHQPTPPGPSKPLLHRQTTKPKAPRIRYCVNTPTSPTGPMDIVSIHTFLLPLDDDCVIRSATVMIERRIQLNEAAGHTSTSELPSSSSRPIPSSNVSSPRASPSSSPASPSYSPTASYQDHPKFDSVATVASDASSNPTITPHSLYPSSSSINLGTRPLLSPARASPPNGTSSSSSSTSSQIPSKVIITPIVGAESSGQFVRDENGMWNKSITLQWPAAKSHSRWAIGETIQSELVSVRFFARVKVRLLLIYLLVACTKLIFCLPRLDYSLLHEWHGIDRIIGTRTSYRLHQ